MANYSVVKNPNGGWDSKCDESDRASSHADTQKEAEADAKRFSANSGGGGKARAGREFIFPTPLFLPAPPECQNSASGFSRKKVRILFKTDSKDGHPTPTGVPKKPDLAC